MTGRKFNIFHVFLLMFCAFWLGILVSNYTISKTKEKPQNIDNLESTRNSDNEKTDSSAQVRSVTTKLTPRIHHPNHAQVRSVTTKLTPRIHHPNHAQDKSKKEFLIHLYGNIWTKFDLWDDLDWQKCQPNYRNCRVTTDKNRIHESQAVVYNAADMPNLDHVDSVRKHSSRKIFLSGLTPKGSKFSRDDYENFFDYSITYKEDSDIQIPYWPNDSLLPSMYRVKKPSKKLTREDLLDLEEEEFPQYFENLGKDLFLGYVMKTCDNSSYQNMFVKKMRDEGLINIYTPTPNDKVCYEVIDSAETLPCSSVHSDECSRHFERFKFLIIPDEELCVNYTTRNYWIAVIAWEVVPMMYGASDYSKSLIPGSYIDMVGNEDYISPSFKKAYQASQDVGEYYKNYLLWKHEDRIEEYHWQCELCKLLNTEHNNKSLHKLRMNEFWNAEKDCGEQLKTHELMRLQLVRTGVIK